jgi:hypothetical protein
MATKNLMIQFETEQYSSAFLTKVYPLFDEAYLFLDPNKKIVVREIAAQKTGGVLASKASGFAPVGVADGAYARSKLIFPTGEREEIFYASSRVPSPGIEGAGLAILQVEDIGFTISSPGQLSVARRIGAHAYLDEIDIP